MSDATMTAEAPDTRSREVKQGADYPYEGVADGAVIGKWAEDTEEALVVAPEKLIPFLTFCVMSKGMTT